jgi:uncharacterized protein YbgA (DUF1722 family)
MKNYSLLLVLYLVLFNNAIAQKSLLNQMASTEVGVVENEAYIKFNFQKHSLDNKVDYNITFFETAFSSHSETNLEFWGHGQNVLSILGPIQLNIEGEEINNFTKKIKEHYLDFQKNIRLKLKAFEHSDVIVFKEVDFIFSAYMNNKTAEYAFWIDKKKYKIDEKSLGVLFMRLESYFKE